jgi:hypothetical protein
MEFFHYPDDDSDAREPLDLNAVRFAGCMLCGAPVALNLVMVPTTEELHSAILALRQHPVPETTALVALTVGICEFHTRDLMRTFSQLEARVRALAAEVKIQ